jgi:propionyl-CoA synthetase
MAHFQKSLGGDSGPKLVDNYWSTESGAPICGFSTTSVDLPLGSAGLPIPGWEIKVMDPSTKNEITTPETQGHLVAKLPLPPGALTSLWNNQQLFEETYLEKYPGYFTTGDAGFVDENGHVTILDDVINVSVLTFVINSCFFIIIILVFCCCF